MAAALAFLHDGEDPSHQGTVVLHRDVKAANILISEDWRAKLANFSAVNTLEQMTSTQVGTPFWAAPEILNNEKYDEKVDVFSYAMSMLEIITAAAPWAESTLSCPEIVFKAGGAGLECTRMHVI